MARNGRWMIVGAVLLGALAACSASSDSSAEAAYSLGGDGAAGAPERASAGLDSQESAVLADVAERQVITTGYVTLTVADPAGAVDDVVAIVADAGGRIDGRYVVAAAEGRHPSASLTVRVPSDEVTATLEALEDIGQLVESHLSADDVTTTVQDLDARIRATEISVERLENLLANATTSEEVIEAESALTERQSNLEAMLTQRTSLGEQVALATISIELVIPAEVPVTASPGFLGGLETGWNGLVAFVTGALVLLGVLIPWLAAAALLAGAGFVLARRARRSRRTAEAPVPGTQDGPVRGAAEAPQETSGADPTA